VADVFSGDKKLGSVGVNFWEINMELLAENRNISVDYKKVSKYPKIERDVAFFVPENYTVLAATNLIETILPVEAFNLQLFDIYTDAENNKKSFGFRISFQSDEKTLSDEFANAAMEKVYVILKKEGFEIR
jgi:phenylalanyl-tRNA synthetase beta subunit